MEQGEFASTPEQLTCPSWQHPQLLTRQYALDLLREVGVGERLVIAMSTEGQMANDNLMALTDVLAQAVLPLDPDAIARIMGMQRATGPRGTGGGGAAC